MKTQLSVREKFFFSLCYESPLPLKRYPQSGDFKNTATGAGLQAIISGKPDFHGYETVGQ
jgi:hypothetical protein